MISVVCPPAPRIENAARGTGIGAVAVDPEESAAVDGPPIRLPRGRQGPHELDVALGQKPLAVPDAVLKIEVAKPRPVAARGELVALGQEVPVTDRSPSPSSGCRSCRTARAAGTTDTPRRASRRPDARGIGQHRIGVAIAADRVGRPLRRPSGGVLVRVRAARVEVEVIGIAQRGVVVGILRRTDPQAARHPQDVADADLRARIAGVFCHSGMGAGSQSLYAPCWIRRPEQRGGEALAHRPALERRRAGDAWRRTARR